MDISTAAWVSVALAAICLLSLAVALVTAIRLKAISIESTSLSDSETRTIVNLRLLESRVSELESSVAEIERSRGSTGSDPEVVDLRVALGGTRRRDLTGVVSVPDAE